jgi:xylan 1,4-beta-xylosidase
MVKTPANRTNFEQVQFGPSGDVKPIASNIIHTYGHWHNEVEVVYAVQGTIEITVTEPTGINETFTLEEGGIAVINASETHSVNTVESGEGEGRAFFLLQFSTHFLRHIFTDIHGVTFARVLWDCPEKDEIRRMLRNIMQEDEGNSPERLAIIHGLSGAVAAFLIKRFRVAAPEKPPEKEPAEAGFEAHDDRLKRITAFINEHYTENPSLDEIAQVAFVSPSYLSHLFSQNMGMAYLQYLNHVKVHAAQHDLRSTDDSMMEILERHGFGSVKTFNRVFKEITGCSPTQYRKNWNTYTEREELFLNEKRPGSYIRTKDTLILPRQIPSGETGLNAFPPDAVRTTETVSVEDALGCEAEANDRYYLRMTGAARAADFLREEVRQHFRQVQEDIGFEYVRFPGIFSDEMCIVLSLHMAKQFDEIHPTAGSPLSPGYIDKTTGDVIAYNWRYVDEVIDFILSVKLRPYIELSFMPSPLASGDKTVFYYKANITPPKDPILWADLIRAFIGHLVERYTLDEVSRWYFEVWNEPNLFTFWDGSFEDYMELYRTSVREIKRASPLLKVGGPALTSFHNWDALPWLEKFLACCAEEKLPLDFISGHPYPFECTGYDSADGDKMLGPSSTCDDIALFRRLVDATPFAGAPLHMNEWNSSANDRDFAHDTAFMAVYLLHNYLRCRGAASALCFWSLSDRFEEHSLSAHEFHGGFGLLSVSGFKKPQYFAFRALKELGDEIIQCGDASIVARSGAGTGRPVFQVLAWNYVHYNEEYAGGDISLADYYERYRVFAKGAVKRFSLSLGGIEDGNYEIEKTAFDREHGSIFDFWLANGAFEDPSGRQKEIIRSRCLPDTRFEIRGTKQGALSLGADIPPFGFVLWRAQKVSKSLM